MLYLIAELLALAVAVAGLITVTVFWAVGHDPLPPPKTAVPGFQVEQDSCRSADVALGLFLAHSAVYILIILNSLRYQLARVRKQRAVMRVVQNGGIYTLYEAAETTFQWLVQVQDRSAQDAQSRRKSRSQALANVHVPPRGEWRRLGLPSKWGAAKVLLIAYLSAAHVAITIYLTYAYVGAPSSGYHAGSYGCARISGLMSQAGFAAVVFCWCELAGTWLLLPLLQLVAQTEARVKLDAVKMDSGLEVGDTGPPWQAAVSVVAYVRSCSEWKDVRLPFPVLEIADNGDGKPACAICSDEFIEPRGATTRREKGLGQWVADPLWELGCEHTFHAKCCGAWFRSKAGSTYRCPLCNFVPTRLGRKSSDGAKSSDGLIPRTRTEKIEKTVATAAWAAAVATAAEDIPRPGQAVCREKSTFSESVQ